MAKNKKTQPVVANPVYVKILAREFEMTGENNFNPNPTAEWDATSPKGSGFDFGLTDADADTDADRDADRDANPAEK